MNDGVVNVQLTITEARGMLEFCRALIVSGFLKDRTPEFLALPVWDAIASIEQQINDARQMDQIVASN